MRNMIRRGFPRAYGLEHPWGGATWAPGVRPVSGWYPVMAPLPVGVNGQPYFGMDPSDPVSWVRPWNPAAGMVARLNFDGAKLQGDTPMGGTWRNPMRDRADVKPRRSRWRRRRLWRSTGSGCITVSATRLLTRLSRRPARTRTPAPCPG